MGNFDSEYTRDKYERWEWDNTKILYANDESRTRVLYIGDSISWGTRDVATMRCEEKILFDGFATSRSIDSPTFMDALKIFASQQPNRRAVLFNNGLHGWHLEDYDEYGYHYEKVVKQIIEHFDEPVIIVLSTTLTREGGEERIKIRNKKAVEIAKKYNLPVIDLFEVSSKIKHLISDGIHYTQEGYEVFTDEIIKKLSQWGIV